MKRAGVLSVCLAVAISSVGLARPIQDESAPPNPNQGSAEETSRKKQENVAGAKTKSDGADGTYRKAVDYLLNLQRNGDANDPNVQATQQALARYLMAAQQGEKALGGEAAQNAAQFVNPEYLRFYDGANVYRNFALQSLFERYGQDKGNESFAQQFNQQQYNQLYNQSVQNYLLGQGAYQDSAAALRAYYGMLGQNADDVSEYWLGVQTGPVGDEIRPFLDLPEGQGVVVLSVTKDSPAEAAGLEVHDIVLALGDHAVKNVEDLYKAVGEIKDKKTSAQIVRRGKKMSLEIQAAKRPEQKAEQALLGKYRKGYVPYYVPGWPNQNAVGGDVNSRLEAMEKTLKDIVQRLEKLEKGERK